MASVIFDIQPASGHLPKDYKKAVAMVFRPYIPVNKVQHDEIERIQQHYRDAHQKDLPYSEEACRNIHCHKWTPEQVATAITRTFYA